jgi:uncharacterized membrane protein YjgN (DUF898 family)
MYAPDASADTHYHDAAAHPPAAPLAFEFLGSGAEYFRIWIVNLLLTVATLGLYSAWAKTRRLQYFYRNTRLTGASFDFRGDPKAILRGRLLAVVVVTAYHYAFGFSAQAGVAIVALLLAGIPFMMRAALRFRLSNLVYRGLPFGFDGGIKEAYVVYFVPVAIFVLPGALLALRPDKPYSGAVFLLYLCWPLLHGAMKAYQHKHLMAGDQHASFPLTTVDLAKPYVRVFLYGLGLLVLLVAVGGITAWLTRGSQNIGAWVPVAIIVLVSYVGLLLAGPYVLVRMNNLAWSATGFTGIRIVCAMRTGPYLRLQVANVLLTVLTLGLYHPFAVVRTWRYRTAHVHVHVLAPDGFEQAVMTAKRRPLSAAGDGIADFLGVDLSW